VAPQPSLGLGLLHKIRLNFLEASQQFSFLQGRVVISTPNPHPVPEYEINNTKIVGLEICAIGK
jgi:hypothetical protein